jgi:NMD protein affecting ribosome stability and mRNA decay
MSRTILKGKCRDCGGPCYQVGKFLCYQCYRRTAALKRIEKQWPEECDEMGLAVHEEFKKVYEHPITSNYPNPDPREP